MARVLRVGQVHSRLDEAATAEEVADLHGDEHGEEHVDDAERDGDLGWADEDPLRRTTLGEPGSDETLLVARREQVAQEAARKPGDAGPDQEM